MATSFIESEINNKLYSEISSNVKTGIFLVKFYFVGPPLWSSVQSSWLQIQRPGFDSRHYEKKRSSESGTGSTQPREYN
jgi:hypothetical protein